MNRYLFRGENVELYKKNNGKLIPKKVGAPFKLVTHYGEGRSYGDGHVYGESSINAVVLHQRDSNKFPTSGVSTTPEYENAKQYATHTGKYVTGYIYKIDSNLLKEFGVTSHMVSEHATEPAIPGDKEIILVASDFGVLPKEIVFEIIEFSYPIKRRMP